MNSYEHTLLGSNFTFHEWQNNETYFECMETSPTQYVMLCKDRWENLGEELVFYKNGAANSDWILTMVLIIIACQLIMILGLVWYIFHVKAEIKEHRGVRSGKDHVTDLHSGETPNSVILTRQTTAED